MSALAVQRSRPLTGRFPALPYSPGELRPVLRAKLQPGERLIGWGVVHEPPDPALALLAVAFHFLPFVSPFVGLLIGTDRRRLLVLTERRLLVLSGRAKMTGPGRVGVWADIPASNLSVRAGGSSGTYELSGAGRVVKIRIADKQGRGAERLREALGLLEGWGAGWGEGARRVNYPLVAGRFG
jgi:hypothetical protein